MIALDRVGFGYGRTQLFSGLDLELTAGNIYGLLGLNGAGKSTLLKLMTGLVFADAGRIRALGHDPAERRPSFLADVFMLPEELNLPGITAAEYVRGLAPFYPRFDAARFERYCTQFELPRGQKLTGHSYGQKKKFLLAFGLATGTRLLVLDEPTNGLDIPSKSLFRRLVAEAATEDRVFVISTHQVRDVEALIDPLIVLHGGQVLLHSSMSEIAGKVRMSRGESAGAGVPLYEEPAVGGAWRVWDEGDENGHLDLEVLFNAIVADPSRFAGLLAAPASGRRTGDSNGRGIDSGDTV